MWPAVFVAAGIAIFVSDPGASNLTSLITLCLSFGRRVDMPIATGPMWSNRVDIIGSVAVAVITHYTRKYLVQPRYGVRLSMLLGAVFFTPACWLTYSDPALRAPPKNAPPIFVNPERCDWITARFGTPQVPCVPSPELRHFMRVVYFPCHYSPAISLSRSRPLRWKVTRQQRFAPDSSFFLRSADSTRRSSQLCLRALSMHVAGHSPALSSPP
ncbi:unnamed protein product [Sphagnum balticum]